ncbi:MAG: hypothetical protein E7168_02865 [Firmicutes bacterium]|nr:hypothetical protein [Bacillota bacterium]
MKQILKKDVEIYISDDNKLGSGKEVSVYAFQDKVIKIFHQERKTAIQRISDDGLKKLSSLNLKCFNVPLDLIVEDNKIVGYTEKFLLPEIINKYNIPLDDLKDDIYILSENGFQIEDLFYNYIFSNNRFYFTDLTCYKYIPTNVDFLKRKFFIKNLEIVNNFLIGFLMFDAFLPGAKSEYTKIYMANEYRRENCPDSYFGDFIKSINEEKKK